MISIVLGVISSIFIWREKKKQHWHEAHIITMKMACFKLSRELSSKDSDFITLLPMIFQLLCKYKTRSKGNKNNSGAAGRG